MKVNVVVSAFWFLFGGTLIVRQRFCIIANNLLTKVCYCGWIELCGSYRRAVTRIDDN